MLLCPVAVVLVQFFVVIRWVTMLDDTMLISSAEEGGYVFSSVCLSVCLSVRLLANLWTDFDEIFCRGSTWLKDQVVQFWWRSGSRFGSGSPKSEIRILRIAVFGGGLCSLSISSWWLFLLLSEWCIYFCDWLIVWTQLWTSQWEAECLLLDMPCLHLSPVCSLGWNGIPTSFYFLSISSSVVSNMDKFSVVENPATLPCSY